MQDLEHLDTLDYRINQLRAEIESEGEKYESFNFPEGSLIKRLIEERKSLVMERALLRRKLKSNGDIPYTVLEQILDELNEAFSDAKSNERVELKGEVYLRRFQPVELSKTGKSVKRYWPYWLRLHEGGAIDRNWQNEVFDLWPDKFLISADRNKARKC